MLPVPQYYYNGKKTRPDEEPHLRVPKDINPKTALHLRSILGDMDRSRKRNDALEEASVKRSKPQEPRVTVKEAMSEIQMFQDEHLKLQKEHHLLKKMVLNLERRLSHTEHLLGTMLQDGSALAAEGIMSLNKSTSSSEILLVTQSLDSNGVEERCTCCEKPLSVCKCFD